MKQKLITKNYKTRDNNISLIEKVEPCFFSQNQKNEIYFCGERGEQVKMKDVETKKEKEKGRQNRSCRSKLCRCCNHNLAKKGYYLIAPITNFCKINNEPLEFITLTFPNITIQDMRKETLSTANKMFTEFMRKQQKRDGNFKKYIKKIECTFNFSSQSFNYHFHLITSKLNISKQEIIKRGTKEYQKFFKPTQKQSLIVDIQNVNFDNIENELTAYVSKDLNVSIEKTKILEELSQKLKLEERQDKVRHIQNQIKAINTLNQEQITKMIILGLKASKGIRMLAISKHGSKEPLKPCLNTFSQSINYEKQKNHKLLPKKKFNDFKAFFEAKMKSEANFEKIKQEYSYLDDFNKII